MGVKKKKKTKTNQTQNKYLIQIKKIWNFIWHDDSFLSYVLNFALAFLFIKYLFFPGIGLVLNNDFPIVAIVSGSMEHKISNYQICDKRSIDVRNKNINYNQWWKYCGDYYTQNYDINKTQFKEFKYSNGLNIGDVMILYGKKPEDIKVGEVLVFIPEDKSFFEQKGPVIHRVTKKWQDENNKYFFETKGDHNPKAFTYFEKNISQEDVIGVAVFRIPYIGYAKIILVNAFHQIINIF
ncbi:MAG: signal peptidase I [Nanoarchaeota archaeon]